MKRRGGFALIIALSLMSFILLLLLSLTTFIRVESESSTTAKQQLAARQNALLGLQLALGELQKLAGSDQRVTARAEILSTTDNPVPNQRLMWTGVWSSDRSDALNGAATAGNPVWLVSGNNPTPQNGSNSGLGNITLVNSFGNGTDRIGEVTAGIIEISGANARDGSYSWWIGDEGVKANVTAIADNVADLSAIERASAPWKIGVEAIKVSTESGESVDLLPGYTEDPVELGQCSDFGSLNFIATSASDLEQNFHNITVHSRALLTDPQKGGLKKDLTRILQDDSQFNRFIAEEGTRLFGPQSGTVSTPADPGGPYWEQLRDWATTGLGDLVVRQQTDTTVGFYPVPTIFQAYMTVGKTTSGADNQALLHLMPAVSLWNPYDRPLRSESGYILEIGASGYEDNSFKLMKLPLILSKTLGEVAVARIIIRNIPLDTAVPITDSDEYFRPLKLRIPGPITLAPGKNTVFSVPPNGTSFHTKITDPSLPLVLEQNWNPGCSYYLESGVLINTGDIVDLNDLTRGEWMAISLKDGNGDELLTTFSMSSLQEEDTPNNLIIADIPDYVGGGEPIDPQLSVGYKGMLRMSDIELEPGGDPILDQPRIGWLAHHNPRGHLQGPSRYDATSSPTTYNNDTRTNIFETVPTYYSFSDYRELSTQRYNDGFNIVIGSNNMVGLNMEAVGINSTPLFWVPEDIEDLISIGQLSHAYLFDDRHSKHSDYLNIAKEAYDFGRYSNLIPAYPIGNSLADPRLPLNATSTNWPAVNHRSWGGGFSARNLSGNTHYDYSHLLNESLWDGFFFSGYDDDLVATKSPLLQGISVTEPDGVAYDSAAAGYHIMGGFNVNSTSVEAWKAVLSSLIGESIPSDDDSPYDLGEDETGFPRSIPANGNGIESTTNYDSADAYLGFKKLSDTEINTLAEALVDEIKNRGPARTLAEFVNRDPFSTTQDHQKQGRLQAAIDRVNLNAGFQVPDLQIDSAAFPSDYTADALTTSSAFGVPGYLTQADILARLGSILTTRSDTFVIRTYGETLDPVTSEPSAQAWCEAIVQRTTEPVVASATDPLNPNSAEAIDFGRRFEIVHIKWLQDIQ